jgi:hypothetical protein
MIVSSSSLNDSLIHLNKFFRVARAVIPVDVAGLEFVWPPDLSKWSRQCTESTFFPPEQCPRLETVMLGMVF